MGLRPDYPDYEPGIDCFVCNDLLFNGVTPKYVEADISGISKCLPELPDPPNGTFLLTQQANPCVWLLTAAGMSYVWELRIDRSLFYVIIAGGQWFNSEVMHTCFDAFVNQNVCGVGAVYGENGYGLCYWGPTIGP